MTPHRLCPICLSPHGDTGWVLVDCGTIPVDRHLGRRQFPQGRLLVAAPEDEMRQILDAFSQH